MGSMKFLSLSSFYMFVPVRAWHMGMSVLCPLEMLSATDVSTLRCLFEGFSFFPVMPSLLILRIGAWTLLIWTFDCSFIHWCNNEWLSSYRAQPWAQRTGEPPTQVVQKSCSAKVHSDWSLLHRAITLGVGASSSWSFMPWSKVKKVDLVPFGVS